MYSIFICYIYLLYSLFVCKYLFNQRVTVNIDEIIENDFQFKKKFLNSFSFKLFFFQFN